VAALNDLRVALRQPHALAVDAMDLADVAIYHGEAADQAVRAAESETRRAQIALAAAEASTTSALSYAAAGSQAADRLAEAADQQAESGVRAVAVLGDIADLLHHFDSARGL
jgi:hypothetical protein